MYINGVIRGGEGISKDDMMTEGKGVSKMVQKRMT